MGNKKKTGDLFKEPLLNHSLMLKYQIIAHFVIS
jgi:hypothetical protein